jgi:hypothetical protein
MVLGLMLLFLVVSCTQGMSSKAFQPSTTTKATTTNGFPEMTQKEQSGLLSVIDGAEYKRSVTLSDEPVYSSTPDWISDSPHYSTGGAFADINNDGWLDFVVSDGNDMGEGHVRIYLNDGSGHLSTSASWQSADVAYNGHLDVADINGDGWLDIAVSYLGTSSSFDPIARVYFNNNGVPSSTADWTANVIGNAFGVDFGDMNNDGRPDLAIATGWSYDSYRYHTYVYLNTDGSYGTSPSWTSDDQNIYMSVLWVDADDDGWLDLVGIGDGCQTQIYRNLGGTLETTASWYTTDSGNQFGIMLTTGDVTGDGIRDLFATDNTQLGGNGYFKQYTGLSNGFYETTYSWGYYGRYGSAVALVDVNGDDTLDLATGAWWENTLLFINSETSLPTTPSWSSGPATVVEKIVFGDIDSEDYEQTFTKQFIPSDDRRLFYLPHRQIQGIDVVLCDGTPLTMSEYTYSRDEGWVSVSTTPDQALSVTYRYSPSQDMGITNWDFTIGNYLYYNQLEFNTTSYPDLDCEGSLSWTDVNAGATVQGNFTVFNIGEPLSLLNWQVVSYPTWGTWSFTPTSGTDLAQGLSTTVHVTVVVPDEKNKDFQGSIRIVNTEDPTDESVIHVTLKTPYLSTQQTSNEQHSYHFLTGLQSASMFHFLSSLQKRMGQSSG